MLGRSAGMWYRIKPDPQMLPLRRATLGEHQVNGRGHPSRFFRGASARVMAMRARFDIRILLAVSMEICCGSASTQRLSELTTPVPVPAGSTIVIGFVGFYDGWNDDHRGVRQLVLRLRKEPGVYAESISNHRRSVALKLVRRALDSDGNGILDPHERAQARVILFGQSWGGAAAIALARDLERLGVPVLLTVQIDSVGVHDDVIPANVLSAVNFYQHDPLTIQGRSEIRAADPARTAILGNFRSSYLFHSADRASSSRIRRTLGGSHARMELDPETWRHVEQFVTAAITRTRP